MASVIAAVQARRMASAIAAFHEKKEINRLFDPAVLRR